MRQLRIVSPVIILPVLLAVFAQVVTFGFVSWDDGLLLFRNPIVQEFRLLQAFTSYDPELYIPFTFLSYQIEYALFGLNASWYHLTNLLLHIGTTYLVYAFIFSLSEKKGVSLVVALLFGIHPMNTETVAWISARKDLLSTFFTFASLVAYVRYRQTGSSRPYWACLTLFACALLSKVSPVLLPLVLLLIDQYQRRGMDRCAWMEKIPFFAVSLIFGCIALVGKVTNVSSLTFVENVLLATKSFSFGLVKLFIPLDQSVIYPQSNVISVSHPDIAVGITGAVLFLVLLILLRKNRAVQLGLSFYLLFLLPSFATFVKGDEVYFFSDRYVYASLPGLLFTLGMLLEPHLKKAPVVPVLLVFGYGLMTFIRLPIWQDSIHLYENALLHYSQSASVHYNLGLAYADTGRDDDALAQYRMAIDLRPSHADAYNNIGVIQMENGDLDEAKTSFETALQYKPQHIKALNNLGTLYGKWEMYEEGLEYFRRAMELDPTKMEQLQMINEALRQ